MQSTVIYSVLTKPELMAGLAKESLVILGVVVVIFIFFKEDFGYSILWLVPVLTITYALLWWVAKLDAFFFKVAFEKIRLRTKNFSKHKGNVYES